MYLQQDCASGVFGCEVRAVSRNEIDELTVPLFEEGCILLRPLDWRTGRDIGSQRAQE